MSTGLNARQRRFAEEYLVDRNATQAAIRAGYSANGADVQGVRLLANASVAAIIAKGAAEISERTKVSQDMVVEGLLLEAQRTDEGSSHAARVSAWEKLGKHLGMFVNRVAVEGDLPPIIIQVGNDDGE